MPFTDTLSLWFFNAVLGFSTLVAAVDPPAKSVFFFFTFWGFSGKPNLISTIKLKSKDPTQ